MKIFLSLLLVGGIQLNLSAQSLIMSVGATKTMTVKSGTILGADSLVLTPTTDFTIASNSISVSPVAILGSPNYSIKRVYLFANQVNYTGDEKIYYKLSELNGNVESTLRFYDSTLGSWWVTEASSSVNTTTHYVQYTTTNHNFISATAAAFGTILPVSLVYFGGSWINNQVNLKWTVSNSDLTTKYLVEYSRDGSTWSTLGEVNGFTTDLEASFYQQDNDEQFVTRFYRVKVLDISGSLLVSKIIRMDRNGRNNGLRIGMRSQGANFYFSGTRPNAVRVLNIHGQLIWHSEESASQYEVNGLIPGVYLVQYDNGTLRQTVKFVVQ
jgi:hypothetical protein